MKPIYAANGQRVFAYRKGPSTKAPRTNPEHALQVAVKQFLVMCLPDGVEWTSSLSGAFLGPSQRAKMKASGLRPGFPDLVFIINRRTFWIELKAPLTVTPRNPGRLGTLDDPGLSDDQKRVLGAMHPDAWAVCRSLDDVAAALTRWGVILRGRPI